VGGFLSKKQHPRFIPKNLRARLQNKEACFREENLSSEMGVSSREYLYSASSRPPPRENPPLGEKQKGPQRGQTPTQRGRPSNPQTPKGASPRRGVKIKRGNPKKREQKLRRGFQKKKTEKLRAQKASLPTAKI